MKTLYTMFLFVVVLILIGYYAYAADVKISALPSATTPTGTEQIPVNQGGTTKRVTIDQITTYVTTSAGIQSAATKTIGYFQANLGFTPYNSTNPSGYQTGSQVVTAITSSINALGLQSASTHTTGYFMLSSATFTQGQITNLVSDLASKVASTAGDNCLYGKSGSDGCFNDWNLTSGQTASVISLITGSNLQTRVTGTCATGYAVSVVNANGTVSCVATGGTGTISTSFDYISSATNTTATMHVGSGASLDATGTGTIAATSVLASGITGSVSLSSQVSGSLPYSRLSGTPVSAATNTCTGTDKFSAYNSISGLFTCTTDSTSTGGGGGTVTSVAVAVPSGFTVSGSPVSSAGTITIGLTGISLATQVTGSLPVAALNGIVGSANGGTGNGYTKFSGPASSEKTFTLPNASATISYTVISGTSSMGTGTITTGTCASVVTTSATGVATTDVINWGFNGDPTGVTGYAPTANGMLTIISYPSTDNVNYKVCNNTAADIKPGAITLNWRIIR